MSKKLEPLSASSRRGGNHRITIHAPEQRKELKEGNSIAVSGVCLTALNIKTDSFCADLAKETWTRTSLSRITKARKVNLELPLKVDGRMGGHIVQGHVDGVARFVGLEPIPNADDFWLHLDIPRELEKYVVFKGSISIEGISLTVAKLEGLRLTIAIIPHTVKMTNLVRSSRAIRSTSRPTSSPSIWRSGRRAMKPAL